MVKWKWEHRWMENISDFPDGTFGFVYEIIFLDGKKYIGKKSLYSHATMNKLKSGKERKGHIEFLRAYRNHKAVELEHIKKESKWKTYQGSFKDSDKLTACKKTILYLAKTSLELTYLEAKAIMETDAIRKSSYINDNVLGRFFKSNFME